MIPVPRRAGLDREPFEREFVRPRRPVVIEGALADWPALQRWSTEHLAERFAERVVGVQGPARRNYLGFQTVPLTFSEYLRQMRGSADPFRPYLGSLPFLRILPELGEDIRVPRLVGERVGPATLWVSAAGMLTPTHLDLGHGLLAQVRGKKRILLVDSRHSRRLYHPSLLKENWYYSPVDLEAPDLARFPRMRGVAIHEAEIGPGDAMYIPSCWRHTVRTVDESLSVGFLWYRMRERFLSRLSNLVGRAYT